MPTPCPPYTTANRDLLLNSFTVLLIFFLHKTLNKRRIWPKGNNLPLQGLPPLKLFGYIVIMIFELSCLEHLSLSLYFKLSLFGVSGPFKISVWSSSKRTFTCSSESGQFENVCSNLWLLNFSIPAQFFLHTWHWYKCSFNVWDFSLVLFVPSNLHSLHFFIKEFLLIKCSNVSHSSHSSKNSSTLLFSLNSCILATCLYNMSNLPSNSEQH